MYMAMALQMLELPTSHTMNSTRLGTNSTDVSRRKEKKK